MAKRILYGLLLLLLLLAVMNYFKKDEVCFQEHCFEVELAQTQQERTRGLMSRENLDPNQGMLFIFEEEAEHLFWMKDTLISLDIIWINHDKEVVFIKEKAQPCEKECEIIESKKKAKYVLEINGGEVGTAGIKIGDKIVLKID